MRIRPFVFFALFCLLSSLLVFATSSFAAGKGPGAARKQIESSMLVTGSIDITPAGEVASYALDAPERLPKGLVDLAARAIPHWKFEAVALQNAQVSRSKMSLQFVATKLDGGRYSIELRNASFYSGNAGESVSVDHARSRLPTYPMQLMNEGVSGTVYLQLQIGRDGKVLNIDASHVNLRVIGDQGAMARWRRMLSRASITAVKDWTFNVPTTGPDAGEPHWFGTLPVSFTFEDQNLPEYGQWETYVAGPRTILPWLRDAKIADGALDALTPNRFHPAQEGRRLLTPLQGG